MEDITIKTRINPKRKKAVKMNLILACIIIVVLISLFIYANISGSKTPDKLGISLWVFIALILNLMISYKKLKQTEKKNPDSLRLTKKGFNAFRKEFGPVLWSDVKAIEIFENSKNLICITINERDKYLLFDSWMYKKGKKEGYFILPYTTDDIEYSVKEIYDLLMKYWDNSKSTILTGE